MNQYYAKNRKHLIEYQSKRYYKLRKYFHDWKATLKCCQCGEDDVACLDFHHSDQAAKEGNIIRMLAKGIKSLQIELKKCVVVCANCHRKIHAHNIETDPTMEDLAESFMRQSE